MGCYSPLLVGETSLFNIMVDTDDIAPYINTFEKYLYFAQVSIFEPHLYQFHQLSSNVLALHCHRSQVHFGPEQ